MNTAMQDAAKFAETGDTLLLSGSCRVHRSVKTYLGCTWSQVGVVLNLDGRSHLLISTNTPLTNDISLKRRTSGVQVVDLRTHLERFEGQWGLRSIVPRLSSNQCEGVLKFVESVRGWDFETSVRTSYRALKRVNKGKPGRVFCSQLVAYCYQSIGVLSADHSARHAGSYLPSDFCPIHESLAYRGSARLGRLRIADAPAGSRSNSIIVDSVDQR